MAAAGLPPQGRVEVAPMPRTRFHCCCCTLLAAALGSVGCRSLPARPLPPLPTPTAPPPPVVARTAPSPIPTVALASEELPALYVEKSTDSHVRLTDRADAERMGDVKPAVAPAPETYEATLARARDLAARRSEAEGDAGWSLLSGLLARLDGPSAIDASWRPTLRAFADGEPLPVLPAPEPLSASEPPAPAAPAFEVAALKLCREVRGFGDYEPFEGDSLRAGESIVVYAEVANLGDREEGGVHRSTLRPRLELRPEAGGEPAWAEDLGEVQDACRRHRRDCYVNARLTIPAGLAPGVYRLRFAAVDALAGAEARAEVGVTVGP